MKKAIDLWRYISKKGLKPLPKTSVSKWADSYRVLSGGISAEPGRWRTDRAPYQREIMDAFTQPGINRVVAKLASQTGKSDCMNNIIGRFAHLDPCPIMMVQPTVEMATDFSKSRIAPMIRDTKALNSLFYDVKDDATGGTAKTRDGKNTILSKLFPGGRLIMCGANSPAGLASRPVRILLCDEVDRFPESAGTEGDPVDLAAKRMTTFWNRCMGLFSTPTNEGYSRIDKEYIAGTQEEWQYECPNCGEYHTLHYRDMLSDYEEQEDTQGRRIVIINNVEWCCPDCGYKFSERQIKNAKAKYVAQNPQAIANGIRSFYVNSFSSPWITWNEIMREWLEAKGDMTREKVVMNTRFGLSYRQAGAFDDETVFLKRREQYGAEIPDGVLMLTAGVDTQDNRLEYEICGWGKGAECWGIAKGVILGVPDRKKTWDDLDNVLDRTYYFKDGTGLKVTRTFIDSGGHYTGHVYKYCEESGAKQRFPIKGQGGAGVPLIHKVAKANNSPMPLIMLGVDDGKQQIMNRLAIDTPGPMYFHFGLDGDDGAATYRGYDELYFKGIISERKVMTKKNGILRESWEQIDKSVRNEPLDLRVYNLACMESCKPDWERLEQVLHGTYVPAKKTVRATKTKKATVDMPARKPRAIRANKRRTSRNSNIW